MRQILSAIAATVSAVVIMQSTITAGQGVQTSSIVGTVFDASGAVVPDAAVMLQGEGPVPSVLMATTDGAGRYRFPVLPPARYRVTSRVEGFQDAERLNIDLPVGATLTLDLILRPSGIAATIDVRQPAPLVDVRSAAAPTHIDRRLLEDLPTRRVTQDLINLAPGVSASVGFGGTQNSNAVYVDGVDTTEAMYGKSYLHITQNWLEQVEVVAIGAGARYGETTGVSANGISRSGTNRFSGLAETLVTRPSWLSRNTTDLSQQLQRNFTPLQTLSWWDTSLQAGGPAIVDHAWYFAGVESLSNRFRPAGYSGAGEEQVQNIAGILKLTEAAGKGVRLEGLLQRGLYREQGLYLGPLNPPDTTADGIQPQLVWNGKATWTLKAKTLIELRTGGYHSDYREDPHGPGTRLGPAPHRDVTTGLSSVNTATWFDGKRSQQMEAVTVASYHDGKSGRHEIQAGLELEHASMENGAANPGGMFFNDDNGAPWRVNVWTGQFFAARSRRVGMFLSDDWHVGRFTLSPGIRVDANHVAVPLAEDVFSTTPVSLRAGVAWDALASHRLVLRAHAGRYYDPIVHGRISTLDRSHDETTTVFEVRSTGELTPIETHTNSASNLAVDPAVKQPYVDQKTAGVEWQFAANTAAEVNYIYRNFGRFLGMVEVNQQWAPVERQDPGPDNLLGTADDGGMLTVFVRDPADTPVFYSYSNPAGAYRRYDGLQIVGRKRLSQGWQARASYTWSRTFGNVDNNSLTNGGVNDLGTGGGFSNPNRFVNQDGRAPYDPRELKLLAVGDVPLWGGFTVGTVARYTSGQAWARRGTIRNMTLGGTELVWVEPRGTRRLPAIKQIDLRVEKRFSLGRSRQLGISGDVFNLTNQGVPNSDLSFPVQTNSGPSLGLPLKWVDPRLLRIGIRLTF